MESEKILENRILSAPPEIKSFLVKGDWSIVIDQISQKNNFSAEQKTSLENEVLFVLLGMELVSDFIKNTQESVGVDASVATQILEEMSLRVFKEIEQFLPIEAESEDVIVQDQPAPVVSVPQISSDIHPMIEEGEVVHDALMQHTTNNKQLTTDNQQVTTNNTQPTTDNSQEMVGSTPIQPTTNNKQPNPNTYPGGIDPYREPLS